MKPGTYLATLGSGSQLAPQPFASAIAGLPLAAVIVRNDAAQVRSSLLGGCPPSPLAAVVARCPQRRSAATDKSPRLHPRNPHRRWQWRMRSRRRSFGARAPGRQACRDAAPPALRGPDVQDGWTGGGEYGKEADRGEGEYG
jgi:hypothetical protein